MLFSSEFTILYGILDVGRHDSTIMDVIFTTAAIYAVQKIVILNMVYEKFFS